MTERTVTVIYKIDPCFDMVECHTPCGGRTSVTTMNKVLSITFCNDVHDQGRGKVVAKQYCCELTINFDYYYEMKFGRAYTITLEKDPTQNQEEVEYMNITSIKFYPSGFELTQADGKMRWVSVPIYATIVPSEEEE